MNTWANRLLAWGSAPCLLARTSMRILLLLVTLVWLGPMAQALPVVNGGFSSVTSAPPNAFSIVLPTPWLCAGECGNGTSVFAPGTADANNSGTAAFQVWPGFPTQSPPAAGGGNFVGVDACYGQNPVGVTCSVALSTVIYQNIGLLAPGNYALTFYQASGQWNGFSGQTIDQWEVGLGNICLIRCGGTFVGQTAFAPTMTNPSMGFTPWTEVTLNFTVPSIAANTPQVLSFLATADISVPPVLFLDGVDLRQVPEPGTVWMLAVGVLALCAVGLRRRASTVRRVSSALLPC